MMKNGMRPIHPGEILREEYLKPLGISPHALSKALKVPPARINDICLGRRAASGTSARHAVVGLLPSLWAVRASSGRYTVCGVRQRRAERARLPIGAQRF